MIDAFAIADPVGIRGCLSVFACVDAAGHEFNEPPDGLAGNIGHANQSNRASFSAEISSP
jgi:hypothetical protein